MENIIYIGIDPGKDGFVTILYDSADMFSFIRMPTKKVDGKTEFSEEGLIEISKELGEKFSKIDNVKVVACIEEVTGRHGWSAQNNFNFGYTAGLQKAFLYNLGDVEVHMVRPAKWQSVIYEGFEKVMVPSSTGKTMVHDTKATSAKVAMLKAPHVDFRVSTRARKTHDGKTDSFLICLYIKQYYEKLQSRQNK
tara:strand:+ start:81 stop:662 length:582 start_codon:yes stop_codon:yes gene_type:complete